MNLVIMCGRLTRDPEVRYTSETAVARFSVAVDRRFKREGQPEADFFSCVAFGKTAEFVEKYLHKGTKIIFDGSIQNNNYTDSHGVQRYDYQINVNSVEFAESKKDAGKPEPATDKDGFMSIPDGIDEELPFT